MLARRPHGARLRLLHDIFKRSAKVGFPSTTIIYKGAYLYIAISLYENHLSQSSGCPAKPNVGSPHTVPLSLSVHNPRNFKQTAKPCSPTCFRASSFGTSSLRKATAYPKAQAQILFRVSGALAASQLPSRIRFHYLPAHNETLSKCRSGPAEKFVSEVWKGIIPDHPDDLHRGCPLSATSRRLEAARGSRSCQMQSTECGLLHARTHMHYRQTDGSTDFRTERHSLCLETASA